MPISQRPRNYKQTRRKRQQWIDAGRLRISRTAVQRAKAYLEAPLRPIPAAPKAKETWRERAGQAVARFFQRRDA